MIRPSALSKLAQTLVEEVLAENLFPSTKIRLEGRLARGGGWYDGRRPRRDLGVSKREFTQRLGEAGYGRGIGRVGVLNLLAGAGLPVPEGIVLTHRAHEEF